MFRRVAVFSIWILALLVMPGCFNRQEREMRAELEREFQAISPDNFEDLEQYAGAAEFEDDASLLDYLRYAALNNPGLKAAFYRWKAALERAPQARALPDPKLTYARYIREVETRVGPLKHKVGVMQMLPWPGKLVHKGTVAFRQAVAQKYLYDAQKLQLFYKVKKAFYEYYYLSRAIVIHKENLKLLEGIEASIRIRYKTAAIKQPALIMTQTELGKLEDRLKSLEALRPALAARLNAALGRDTGALIPWPKEMPQEPGAQDEEQLFASLREHNPELQAAREKIRAAEAGRSLAQDQYLPNFGLGMDYIQADRRTDMAPDDNGKDPVMVMFEITLPIWYEKYNAGVREATARVKAAAENREDMANKLSADLRVALFHYQDAGRKLNLFRDTLIPKAEQGLTSTQTAFSASNASYFDMIDAERTLLEFRLLSERALVDRSIRLAELETLAGRELRKVTHPQENTEEQVGYLD